LIVLPMRPLSPEPTHWLTETVVEPGPRPMNSFEILALQRSVLPPPLVELLHCVTAVTGVVSTFVVVEQAKPPVPLPSVGAPAEPRHSRTVTVAVPVSGSVPAAEVILLTTVTSQIRPWPPWLPIPLPHVVAAAMVAADAPPVTAKDPRSSSPPESRTARDRRMMTTYAFESRRLLR